MTVDEQLGLTDQLLEGLRKLGAEHATPDQMIRYLSAAGVSKPGAILALRRTKVMPSSATKQAVHFHPDYAYRREPDEEFWDSAAQVMVDLQPKDVAA